MFSRVRCRLFTAWNIHIIAIRRDSISLLRFPFLRQVHVFTREMSLVYRLKYPYNCYLKRFNFSLKVSFSKTSPCFHAWDVACLPLETSMELFFFPLLFSGYCRSAGPRVVSIVSGGCNQFFLPAFLSSLRVVLSMCQSYLHCCQVLFLPLFLTHKVC